MNSKLKKFAVIFLSSLFFWSMTPAFASLKYSAEDFSGKPSVSLLSVEELKNEMQDCVDAINYIYAVVERSMRSTLPIYAKLVSQMSISWIFDILSVANYLDIHIEISPEAVSELPRKENVRLFRNLGAPYATIISTYGVIDAILTRWRQISSVFHSHVSPTLDTNNFFPVSDMEMEGACIRLKDVLERMSRIYNMLKLELNMN